MGKRKTTLQHATLTFKINGVPTQWDVVHNLDEIGADIEAAFINWEARTDTYTIEDFISYVRSKDPLNIICITLERYNELKQEVENESHINTRSKRSVQNRNKNN